MGQELWIDHDLPSATALSVDEVSGVGIKLDELIQLQAKLLNKGMGQSGAEKDIFVAGSTTETTSIETSFILCPGISD